MAAAAVVACGICVAGCGDDEPRTTTAAPPSGTTTAPPTTGAPTITGTQTARCTTDMLEARLEPQPGAAASALMHWGAVPGQGDATEEPCRPGAAVLLVTPPDERTSLAVPFGQSVCQGGHIDVTALVPGQAGPDLSG